VHTYETDEFVVRRAPSTIRPGDDVTSEFLLPPGGQAIIAFHALASLTSQEFGRDLVVEGALEPSLNPFALDPRHRSYTLGHACPLVRLQKVC
jgi:hypothetical protein